MRHHIYAIPMKEWSEMISAVADLLWPIIILVIAIMFRDTIRDLAHRLKRGKLLGQELELEKSITQLNIQATASYNTVPLAMSELEKPSYHDTTEDILKIAAASPTAGLMKLSADIERELRHFTGSGGHHTYVNIRSPRQVVEYWQKKGLLPAVVVASTRSFFDVRDNIVHGYSANPKDVMRVIDSGMTILKTLHALPHEVNTVYHTGVDLYADKECKERRQDVSGIILETLSPGGAVKTKRISPPPELITKKEDK